MQVMIDTDEHTPAQLRFFANLLIQTALFMERPDLPMFQAITALPQIIPGVNKDTQAPPVPVAPSPVPAAPVADAVSLPGRRIDEAGTPRLAPLPPSVLAASPPLQGPIPSNLPIEYDSRGFPWDSRIHQDSRNKKISGVWKNRKGIDPAIVHTVEAELEPRRQLPQPAQTSFVPPIAPGAQTPIVPAGTASPVFVPPVHSLPPDEPASIPRTAQPVTIAMLMTKITQAMAAGKLTHDEMNTGLSTLGLQSMVQLNTQQELIPFMDDHVTRIIAAKG